MLSKEALLLKQLFATYLHFCLGFLGRARFQLYVHSCSFETELAERITVVFFFLKQSLFIARDTKLDIISALISHVFYVIK